MIGRIALAACALLALVLAVAFEVAAFDLLRSADRATAIVPCALGLLMIWLTVDICWGGRRNAAEETALAFMEEAPTPAVD